MKVGEHFQQVGLELVIGTIDFIDEQHRCSTIARLDGPQQGTTHEKTLVVQFALQTSGVFAGRFTTGFSGTQVQQLTRIIPVVHRLARIDAFVALQTDEFAATQGGEHLGKFGLADTGFTFEQERALQRQRQKYRSGETLVSEISRLGESITHLLNRCQRRARCRHGNSLRRTALPSFVVDLGITGRTAAVAAGTAGLGFASAQALVAAGVRVVDAPDLPDGWAGKPHACAIGAARGTRLKSDELWHGLDTSTPRQLGPALGVDDPLGRGAGKPVQPVLVVRADPGVHRLHVKAATIQLLNKNPAAAILQLQRACREQPDSWIAQVDLATAYQFTGDLTNAISGFKRALRLNPEPAAVYANLADLFFETGRDAEALDTLEAGSTRSNDLEALRGHAYNRGLAFIREGASERSLPCFAFVVRHARENRGQIYFLMGQLYEGLNLEKEARASYELATREPPLLPQAFIKLALMRFPNDPERAIRQDGNLGSCDFIVANTAQGLQDGIGCAREQHLLLLGITQLGQGALPVPGLAPRRLGGWRRRAAAQCVCYRCLRLHRIWRGHLEMLRSQGIFLYRSLWHLLHGGA